LSSEKDTREFHNFKEFPSNRRQTDRQTERQTDKDNGYVVKADWQNITQYHDLSPLHTLK